MTVNAVIRVGIGGWTFEPWRGVFYPKGLTHAKELAYASARLTTIEINGTFYRTQTPATFRKWASEVPDGFVFSVKGAALHRQPARARGGRRLHQAVSRFRRHRAQIPSRSAAVSAIRADQEVRRSRFRWLSRAPAGKPRRAQATPRQRRGPSRELLARLTFCASCANSVSAWSLPSTRLIRRSPTSPRISLYARLQKGKETIKTGYPPKALDAWAERLGVWAGGGEPKDLGRA